MALPALALEDHHTADTEYINAAVHARFGLDVTVLRFLSYERDAQTGVVCRTVELESHGSNRRAPAGCRWYPPDAISAQRWQSADDRAVSAEWRAAVGVDDTPADGCEWTRAGWWDEACAWIRQAVPGAAVTEVVQVRTWHCSCVIRVHTTAGAFYFKALPQSLLREWALTTYLSGQVGVAVASVVAAQRERRWLLMRAFMGSNLEATADVSKWEQAVRAYAQLQVACAERTADLVALGCSQRPLAALAAASAQLCADTAAMLPGRAEGLPWHAIDRLPALVPELQQRCAELECAGVPATLEHGDLWPANVLVNDAACAVIDWEDGGVAHPFLSLAPLIAGLRYHHPGVGMAAAEARLRAAFLAPFATLAAPEALRRAYDLARPLAMLDMAVRYWRAPAAAVQMHPWMREMVPWFIGFMLGELGDGAR